MQSLKRAKPTIGVLAGWSPVIGSAPDRYLASIVAGIQSTTRLKGCNLMIAWGIRQEGLESGILYPAWPQVAPDSDFVPVGPWNTDGLIVLAPLRHPVRTSYLQRLSRQGFPVLYVAAGENGPTISAGNEEGIQQAVDHLVQHGHQRVAFIAGDMNDRGDSDARLRGYRKAVAKHGLATEPGLVIPGWHTDQGGYAAVREMLELGVQFSAIVASDDRSAIGAMRALREAGRSIPNDVAIIGFDDQPEAAAQVPALASIHAPLPEMGQQAALLMLEHLLTGTKLESIRIPTRVVPRQSCGCMPAVVISAGHGESRRLHGRPDSAGDDAHNSLRFVTNEMLAAIPAQARLTEERRIHEACHGLVQAVYDCLQAGQAAPFRAALVLFLQMIESTDISTDVWQEMISILRRELVQLPLDFEQLTIYRLAEDLLQQARAAISESAQRRDQQHQFELDSKAHAMGVLTSQLGGTVELADVARLLDGNVMQVGIRRVYAAVFEAEGDDGVAWSSRLNPDPDTRLRFPTREFPPPALVDPAQAFSLSVLPLLYQNEALGYIAFEDGDLSACIAIARQVAVALKMASLHKQVVELSLTDPLTGLYNRRYFELFLKNEVRRSRRFGRALSVLLVDLDRLKEYNDSFGHPEGDEALRAVAQCLLDGRRTADVMARIGGDEFALILPETAVDGAQQVARKLAAALARLTSLKSPLTLSVGITALGAEDKSAEQLVREADRALYAAKKGGRDLACVFDPQVHGGRST
jgi:diguanylate cyclase (GGDEF)-like protein